MKLLVFCALIVLGLQAVSAQTVTIEPEFTSPVNHSVVFSLKKPLVLTCNVNITEAYTTVDVEWMKGDKLVSEVASLKDRFKISHTGLKYTLTIAHGDNSDVGNWSCSAMVDGQNKAVAEIHVVTSIAVKIKADNINVVEEEKLRIECSVLGNPYPSLSWRVETDNYNGTVFDDRVKIQDYTDDNTKTVVENAVFIIEKVNKSDRGLYYCIAVNKYWEKERLESQTMVRVKDKYAALWPFLGICAEVIVLCAVIIIYEKKRNKTELEESDTDQSPDQKNTPDHGKDANLRHRQ